jgi:hypothetical protein
MGLEEYLYVDDKRLDTYADQIGSPLTFEKVPVWTASISLTGPKADGKQERHARPLTRSEKIGRLMDYLTKEDRLGSGRLGAEVRSGAERLFRLETCKAAQVIIPPLSDEDLVPEVSEDVREHRVARGRRSGWLETSRRQTQLNIRERQLAKARRRLAAFKGLSIWYSGRPESGPAGTTKAGPLFLVVGYPWDDQSHFGTCSAYSALAALLEALGSERDMTALRDVRAEGPSSGSGFTQLFLRDPLRALEDAGADMVGWRDVKCLYRVRDAVLYREPSDDAEAIATIGYPIYIAEK